MINILIYVLLFFYVLCAVLLVFIILMQRPRSEGLGASFGGGVTQSLFGAGTSDVLTKITIVLGSAFFILTLLLAILYAHRSSVADRVQSELLAPAATGETALPMKKNETAPPTPSTKDAESKTDSSQPQPAQKTQEPAPSPTDSDAKKNNPAVE
ncbi:MAG: preprotein translocase subunit SecG [bacterium]